VRVNMQTLTALERTSLKDAHSGADDRSVQHHEHPQQYPRSSKPSWMVLAVVGQKRAYVVATCRLITAVIL
jgi:hypothetical protein